MSYGDQPDLFHGLFARRPGADGLRRLTHAEQAPRSLPDPKTGRALEIATVDAGVTAVCPSCSTRAEGEFVSFVADLRLVYACPQCQRFVWLAGA